MYTPRLWSKTRKQLEEEFLCEPLRGRVRYFNTRYRRAHDDGGRVCVLVDDEEKLDMPFTNEYVMIYSEVGRRDDGSKPWRDLYGEVKNESMKNGVFAPWDFGRALDEYFASSIDKSLQSENLLVRLLAILDRRVGKRTLDKIKPTLDTLPPWLRYFYELRLESEAAKKVGASVPASPCPGGTKCG